MAVYACVWKQEWTVSMEDVKLLQVSKENKASEGVESDGYWD